MGKKPYTNKRDRINMHKLLVLNNLIMETLDELKVSDDFRAEHVEAFTPAMEYVERFMDNGTADNDNDIRAYGYISDLSEKINTVMRKNYKPR